MSVCTRCAVFAFIFLADPTFSTEGASSILEETRKSNVARSAPVPHRGFTGYQGDRVSGNADEEIDPTASHPDILMTQTLELSRKVGLKDSAEALAQQSRLPTVQDEQDDSLSALQSRVSMSHLLRYPVHSPVDADQTERQLQNWAPVSVGPPLSAEQLGRVDQRFGHEEDCPGEVCAAPEPLFSDDGHALQLDMLRVERRTKKGRRRSKFAGSSPGDYNFSNMSLSGSSR